MGKLFERVGMVAPGKVNLFMDGRFQTVVIDDLPDDKLQQLFDNGCTYVQPTLENLKSMFPDEKLIEVKPIVFKENLSSQKK